MAGEVDKAEDFFAAGDFEDVAGLELFAQDAVCGYFEGVIVAQVLHLDLRIGIQDDGAVGDGVGADRGDDDGVEVGGHDRAAGRERIGGRAVRGGDDDAVCYEGVEVGAVDMDGDFDQACIFASMDDEVVDGKLLLAAREKAVDGDPLGNLEVAEDDVVKAGVDFRNGDIGHKAGVAEVDADDRWIDVGKFVDEAKNGPVAAH